MKTLILIILFSISSFAADLTHEYQANYGSSLTKEELQNFMDTEIVLVPGIGSETFIWEDHRGVLDFSFLFKDSFGAQLSHYRKLGIPTRRLWASSFSVQETVDEVAATVEELRQKNKKVLFISHSLGGLALLDYLIGQENFENIQGILFLQSPFYGSPIASLYFQNPYFARSILGPVLSFVNTSEDSIEYLSLEARIQKMTDHKDKIARILSTLPVLTMSGTILHHKSLMGPSRNVMGYGCVTYLRGRCRSQKIFNGPYSDSDGMVPLESSKLPGTDFVVVDGVDHGETMQAMPYKSVNRVKLTDALMKILIRKI
jgi:triacylglycerol lipase